MRIYQPLRRACVALAVCCIPLAIAGPALATITIATVPVGNAGNAADPSTTYGAVILAALATASDHLLNIADYTYTDVPEPSGVGLIVAAPSLVLTRRCRGIA